mgnify:CR=1 FL=1
MAATNQSAGILLYRKHQGELQVFLVHPGGPFWVKKDLDAWSIPKGEYDDNEEPLEAAKREFGEETGFDIFRNDTAFIELSPVVQKGGKRVKAWACEGNVDPAQLKSNAFTMEWPPKSGKQGEFPEMDKGEWMNLETAKQKIKAAQIPLLEELKEKM